MGLAIQGTPLPESPFVMILTPSEMIALEQSAFDDGVSAEALMDDAGAQMAAAIQQFCPTPGECAAIFGKGHNGGDALVAARHLASAGWKVHVVPAFPARPMGSVDPQEI